MEIKLVLAHAIKAEELRQVTDVIHDWWFDLDQVDWNSSEKKVSIVLYENHQGVSLSSTSRTLLIRGVRSVTIRDEERVGIYDIHKIVQRGPSLIVLTGVPLEFAIETDGELDVEVIE